MALICPVAAWKLVWLAGSWPPHLPPVPTASKPLALCRHIHPEWGCSRESSGMPAPSHDPAWVSSTLGCCGPRTICGNDSFRAARELGQKLQGRTEEGSAHVPWGTSGAAARRSCLLSCMLRRWAARAGQLPWLPSEFCINQTFDPRGCSQKVGRWPESGLG